MLRQVVEADPQHQLGAATWPTAFTLHLLQPFEQTADIEDDACAIAWQYRVQIVERPAGIGREVGDIPCRTLTARCVGRRIRHRQPRLEVGPLDKPANAFAGLDLEALEIASLAADPRRQPRQRTLVEIELCPVGGCRRDAMLSRECIFVEPGAFQPTRGRVVGSAAILLTLKSNNGE